jgi:hypothetical protein
MAERSRGQLTFKQRDLTAAIRAARAAGCEVVRVEIDKAGKIAVVTSPLGLQEPTAGEANEWDGDEGLS